MTFSETPSFVAPQAWFWHPGCDASAAWDDWARQASEWLRDEGVEPREALVTLPVGAVLAAARQAWARAVGGWVPRIETIASLAETHSWARATPVLDSAGQELFGAVLSLDAIEDRLQAARGLGRQAWARQWAARDRRGYEFALDQVVDAAHAWLRALQGTAPRERPLRIEAWRNTLQEHMGQGPGGRERLLLAWALEWAAVSAEGGLLMDAVYAERPSAWLAITVGSTVLPGSEGSLMLAALGAAGAEGVPVRWWAAEVASVARGDVLKEAREQERDTVSASEAPLVASPVCMTVHACGDMLDEARRAAAQVLLSAAERQDGAPPVGLLALDRGVVRHVRALLEGAGLIVADETGWLLSTTRAAAACTRLLAAANPRASTDELLDWLKSGWVRTDVPGDLFAPDDHQAIGLLERWCRRQGLISAWSMLTEREASEPFEDDEAQLSRQRMPDEARVMWLWSRQAVRPLQDLWKASRPTLEQWLRALRQALEQSGASEALLADPAGTLLWETLRLDSLASEAVASPTDLSGAAGGAAALPESYRITRMDGASFQRWLADVLEAVTFRPQAEAGRPDVVITTLARAALRPFHVVVMPGADEKQLGALGSPQGWLGVRLREAMGLATPVQARQAQWEAFRLVATRPSLHALHRVAEGSEPLEASAWLARWAGADGGQLRVGADPRPWLACPASPMAPPQPVLGAHGIGLPPQLSATHYEVLRQCPYRFFAQVILRLQTQDELEEGLARSDHGSWLHETLRRFHELREQRLSRADDQADVDLWLASARSAAQDMGLLSDAMRPHFRPHEAALPDLARAYVSWLGRHERDGWRVRACEVERERRIDLEAAAPGLRLRLVGQLDRVDVRNGAYAQGGQPGESEAMVIDYKTGSAVPLKQKVKAGAEDTQLAFYAALSEGGALGDGAGGVPSERSAALQAAYVHIDPRKVETLRHADVEVSAAALLSQLSRDWVRMHQGAPLLALGDGSACEHCAMRGLCRRDHWPAQHAKQGEQGARS